MKYSFEFFARFDSGWNGRSVPSLIIDDSESYGPFFGAELNNLRLTYLEEEILPSLEKVFFGQLPGFGFGYEIYDFVCDKQSCRVFDRPATAGHHYRWRNNTSDGRPFPGNDFRQALKDKPHNIC